MHIKRSNPANQAINRSVTSHKTVTIPFDGEGINYLRVSCDTFAEYITGTEFKSDGGGGSPWCVRMSRKVVDKQE